MAPKRPQSYKQLRLLLVLFSHSLQNRSRAAVRGKERRRERAPKRVRRMIKDCFGEKVAVDDKRDCAKRYVSSETKQRQRQLNAFGRTH